MNKIRIIDLLNKIANGEEMPKKIKYDIGTWEWNEKQRDYIESNGATRNLFTYYLDNITEYLNDEIEIIKEEKQIKKFEINYARDIEEKIFYEESDKPNHCILRDAGTELLINKINELIENQNKIIRELKVNNKQ